MGSRLILIATLKIDQTDVLGFLCSVLAGLETARTFVAEFSLEWSGSLQLDRVPEQ